MWRAVTEAVGVQARDSLWDYPDLIPASEDIDDPSALIARLEAQARGEAPAADDLDDALAKLLAEETERDGHVEEEDPEREDPGEERPEGDRPV
jgi:hypothetical protein